MSQVDELFNSLSDEDKAALYSANPDTEPHIIINDDRYIIVPDSLKRLGVKNDKNIETVTWDCPRYWDEHDMSKMVIYIIYKCSDNYTGKYKAYNVKIDDVDSKLMHFDWTISENVTQVAGKLRVNVCIKDVDADGNETEHWNSEITDEFYISESLDCDGDDDISASYPDLVTEMMKFMNEGVKNGSITYEKLADDSVDYNNLRESSVYAKHLSKGAVTGDKIADGAIKKEHLEEGLLEDVEADIPEHSYWKIRSLNPARSYEEFDALFEDEYASDTLYQITISGLSPMGSTLGAGSELIGVIGSNSGIMTLFNKASGEKWSYEKGSNTIEKLDVSVDLTELNEALNSKLTKKDIELTGSSNGDEELKEYDNSIGTVYGGATYPYWYKSYSTATHGPVMPNGLHAFVVQYKTYFDGPNVGKKYRRLNAHDGVEDIWTEWEEIETGQTGSSQLTPEFVSDISECTDTDKIYVLPDGYIYAYMKDTVNTEETFGTTDWSTFNPVSTTENSYVFNHIGAPSAGNLKSISMKCDAVTSIKLAIAHMSNGVVTGVDDIQVNTRAGENTYVNGVDFYYDGTIQEGDLIGYRMDVSCKIYYGPSTIGWCYKSASLTDYTLTQKSYGFALSAVVESSEEIYTWSNTGVSFTSGDHDSRIKALEDDVAELKKGTPKADVATIGTEIEPVIDNYADSEAFVIKVKASETSGTLTMEKSEDVNTSAVRQICYVDFANNKIGFYNKSADGAALTIHREKTLGFSVVAGHEYVVEMIKRDSKYAILKVTDTYSLDSDEISCSEFEVGRGWGSRKYTYTGDSDDILSVKSYILQNKKTKLLIVGDSYIEGSSLPEFGEDRDNRYAMRLKNALNGDCFINGRGGAASANILGWFNTYLPEVCQPEYTIVSCGGNDGNYDNWVARYNAIIAKIEEMGSKPILTTVAAIGVGPCKDIFGQMNEWIRNRGYDYIDVNLVTSLNYEGAELNPEYVVSDNVHPNSVGHEIIFKRALLDVPYIFRNDSSIVDGNEVAY